MWFSVWFLIASDCYSKPCPVLSSKGAKDGITKPPYWDIHTN